MIKNLQNILTQSHSMTSNPVYVVYSKQEICVDGDFEFDKIIYVKNGDSDYPELTYEEFEELEEEYNRATEYRSVEIDSSGNEVIREMPTDHSGDEFDPDDWEKRYIKYIDRFEGAFFIRQNAENFLANQRHNLSSPYIYIESAYRNPEWQQIRKLLLDKALVEGNTVSV